MYKGYKHSEETKRKIGEASRRRGAHGNLHKITLDEYRKGKREHTLMIRQETENFQQQGYNILFSETRLKGLACPDIIVRKNGKVYAVEVERYWLGKQVNYGKYPNDHRFDDVIWILKERKIEKGEEH